MENDHRVRP